MVKPIHTAVLLSHKHLVILGEKWLKKQGFGLVLTEVRSIGCPEEADVFGFRASCSALIEVKVSKSDFKADFKKSHRCNGAGIGTYRFYLSPPGIIGVQDLPKGWGLLHTDGKTVSPILIPLGNFWPGYSNATGDWLNFRHLSDMEAERNLLYSYARRIKQNPKKMHI